MQFLDIISLLMFKQLSQYWIPLSYTQILQFAILPTYVHTYIQMNVASAEQSGRIRMTIVSNNNCM